MALRPSPAPLAFLANSPPHQSPCQLAFGPGSYSLAVSFSSGPLDQFSTSPTPSEIQWWWFQDPIMSFQIISPIPSPHFKGILQSVGLSIHGGYQKTIQGHQSPGPSGVGYFISMVFPQGNTGSGFFKGNFKRLLIIKSIFKASRTQEILGKLNWSIQVVLRQPAWHWPIWTNLYSTVGIQDIQLNTQDFHICNDPNSQYSWVINPPG